MENPKFHFRGMVSQDPSLERIIISIYLIEESPHGEYFVGQTKIVEDAVMPFPAIINKVEIVEKGFRLWVISGQFWGEEKIGNCLKAMLNSAREQYIEGCVPDALLFHMKILGVGNDFVDFIFG